MEENKKSDNLKNAIAYIPLAALVLFFTEENKSVELKKHIKYGVILLGVYVILNAILGFLFGALLFLIYLGGSGFLAFKAYQGEDIQIEHIDNFEKKVKDEYSSSNK